MEKKVLVSVKDIREEFPVSTGFAKKGVVKALDGISFDIYQGETVGLALLLLIEILVGSS